MRTVIIIILLSLLPVAAIAQWTEPVPIDGTLGFVNARAYCVGETLHVVSNIGFTAYYVRSNDNGFNWTSPFEIPPDSGANWMTDIKYSNGKLHYVCKFDGPDFPLRMIHMSSLDGGRNWSDPQPIFNSGQNFIIAFPRIVANGDSLSFICFSNPYILAFRSFDAGQTWQDSTVVDGERFTINSTPTLLFANGRLHFIYEMGYMNDSTGFEIYYRSSDDFGLTWSPKVNISVAEHSPNVEHSQSSAAGCDLAGNIVVTWFDYKYGSYCGFTGDILARVSRDNGDTWLPESRLTYAQSGDRSACEIVDDVIYAVWSDYGAYGCEWPKIMFSSSTDWGETWSTPEIITGPSQTIEMMPDLTHNYSDDNLILHCLLSKDFEDNGSALHYLRNANVTEIENYSNVNTMNTVSQISVYPNPFNQSVTFHLAQASPAATRIDIFNILGQRVESLRVPSESKQTATWNAGELPSGVYFYRAYQGNSQARGKLILLK